MIGVEGFGVPPRRPAPPIAMLPTEADEAEFYWFWLESWDTRDIATMTRFPESVVYNSLARRPRRAS